MKDNVKKRFIDGCVVELKVVRKNELPAKNLTFMLGYVSKTNFRLKFFFGHTRRVRFVSETPPKLFVTYRAEIG